MEETENAIDDVDIRFALFETWLGLDCELSDLDEQAGSAVTDIIERIEPFADPECGVIYQAAYDEAVKKHKEKSKANHECL